jgi:hypothetical protein
MKKYKVEITSAETYVIDVLANSQDEAEGIALDAHGELDAAGTLHYHMTGEREETATNVFDVTDTDDAFSPVNETTYAARVRELEDEGLTTSDAQGVAMAEGLDARE